MFRKALLVALLLAVLAISGRQLSLLVLQTIEPSATINAEQFPRLTLAEIQRLRDLDRISRGAGKSAALLRARQIATMMPLSDTVLGYAALAIAAQDPKGSDALLKAALQRNPRNSLARLRQAQATAARGDYSETVRQIEALLRLQPEGKEVYVKALALMAQDPKGRAALLQGLTAQPPWADALARQIAIQYPASPFTLQVLRLAPSAQDFYLQERLKSRAVDRAFLEWLSFLPSGARTIQWPYDGTFKGAPAAEPFNWSINRDSAEFNQGGGLYVTTFGRKPVRAATQVLLLGAGAYRLKTVVKGETRPRGGYFRWSMTCLEEGAPLLELDLRPLSEKWSKIQEVFVVPTSACAAQKLELRGVPGELPLWARSLTQSVSIETAPDHALSSLQAAPSADPAPPTAKSGADKQIDKPRKQNAVLSSAPLMLPAPPAPVISSPANPPAPGDPVSLIGEPNPAPSADSPNPALNADAP